ncbi:MAG TPA: SgcJ/EcaC family oxidoreductase [Vicinamibacteria bacterium]|nr:SgcJ/EcaC family oxidoreductase [Vicinamibacteria bacterium]
MRQFASTVAIVTALLVVALAAPAATEDVGAAISAANKRFSEAVAKGDADAVAALYTRTARALPPNGEPVQGREAILKMWQGMLSTGIRDAVLTSTEAAAMGDTAWEEGTYVVKTPDGQVADRGKYVVVWKKEDGGWKLHRDIWNSNQPLPGR